MDAGANSDCKPNNLLEFGIMGNIYMEKVLGRKNPTVGLVNIGAEASKGSTLTKAAYSLLEQSDMNFIGNVEGRAHATYVFGIGGLSKAAVEENAIADMYRNADLSGAQAVTNVTTTVKTRVFPFVVCYEYIASGQVIEFTE